MSPGSILRLLISGIVTLGCGATNARSLQADVIYSNFGTDESYSAGTGLIVTNDGLAWSSIAIAFIPSANYYLTNISFVATGLVPDSTDSATLAIFADNSGQPDATPLEMLTSGPLGQFGVTVPVITLTSALQPLLLADTQYWIGMNAPAGSFIVWNQNTSLAAGFFQTDGAGNWSASGTDQGAVEIDGTVASVIGIPTFTSAQDLSSVPEPATWWLIAITSCAYRAVTVRKRCSALTAKATRALHQPKRATP